MTKTRQSYGLQPIDQNLTKLLQPLFHGSKKEFALISNLARNWQKIVGKKYANLCYPKSVVGARHTMATKKTEDEKDTARRAHTESKLTIAVYNPAVGFFLENNSDLIIERLAIFCGYKLINKIIIKQEPKEIEVNKETEIKLDETQQKFLQQKLQGLENSELSDLLKKIGATILQENKT